MIARARRRRSRRLVLLAIALLSLAGSADRPAPAPGAAGAWCSQACARVWRIHYRTHDGLRRSAAVVLPEWYGPQRNPPIPLVISPHGRGVSSSENVERWANLPALGGFAVVNPDGQGRRLRLFSWGYPGQIEDLAAMPRIVQRALPWLRIDRKRVYAFGTSMGGQETLLLAARHPSLLAGAAAFDAVTDLSRRYAEFSRLRCSAACQRAWGLPLGVGLQRLARAEIGGPPRRFPRRYARRSPITYARVLAASGVPIQLLWSSRDRVVGQRTQSERFLRVLRRFDPVAPVTAVVGGWPHASDMNADFMLDLALRRFGLLSSGVEPPMGTRTLASAQRLVHPRLPWHSAVVDRGGKLLAWYRPAANLGYDRVLRLGWRFIEERARRVYLRYAVFDERTLRGIYWQHSPAFLNAAFVDSVVAWYPYSGDRRAVAAVRGMLDYQLRHGTTPAGWAWPRVPFPTSCGGDREYGRCLADTAPSVYGGVEPDKVGLLGRGYLRFYELTGERRFLRAAIRAGDALARHVRAGDAARTPWPFRVNGRTGRVIAGARFGGAVVGPVALLDELVRLGAGDVARYRRARDLAWSWLLEHQLNPASATFNRWSGFYEDVRYNPASRNQAVPTLTALYLLDREDPGSLDPLWERHASSLLAWVRSSFGRGPFLGAWGIDEQRAPGRPGCCSRVGLGSTSSRWAAANALLSAHTGDERARELAFRSLNYATYFAAADGKVACCGLRTANTYWFSDGYGDYLRSFSWAMAALPELAPVRQNHLLGSSSVVRSVAYGPRSVTYATFDPHAVDVLRVRFEPRRVLAGGKALSLRDDLAEEGYTVRRAGADAVVRVRHDRSGRIQLVG